MSIITGHAVRVPGDIARRLAMDPAVACVVTAMLAVRFTYKDFPVGALIAIVLLPVTLPAARRYRGGITVFAVSVLAAGSGAFLTLANSGDHEINVHRMLAESFFILGLGVTIVTLVWARSIVGLAPMALSYGVGTLLSLGVTGVNHANIWKFSLSVPVTLIVLSLPFVASRVWLQVVLMVGIAGVSAALDSRSLAATLLVGSALLLIRREPGRGTARRVWRVIVQITLIGVGGFFAVQAAVLDGMLGEQVQTRTQAQIQTAGNIFAGGRPEMGATNALLHAQPLGFGTGVIPSYRDVMIAKQGMSTIGYNPQNGYVDNYMFGNGFEVHSVVGDLWLLAGIAGALLALALLVSVIVGMAHSIAYGTAIGVALFLGSRSVWDSFFSPLLTTFFTIGLCVALLLPAIAADHDAYPYAIEESDRARRYAAHGHS